MAANTSPIFPLTPKSTGLSVVGSSAVTARTAITGTTGLTLLFTAGSNGSRIDTMVVQATGTSLSGLLDFWIYDGTTSRLFYELTITAVTPSTTASGFNSVVNTSNINAGVPITIPSGTSLYCSSQVANQLIGVIVFGGDY